MQWHVLVVKSQAAVVNETQLNDELHLANEHGEFGWIGIFDAVGMHEHEYTDPTSINPEQIEFAPHAFVQSSADNH